MSPLYVKNLEQIKTIDPTKEITDVILLDGESNVQLSDDLLKIYYPKMTVIRVVEHTNYWHRLTMVAWAGGYYRAAFWGERGVTQGDPLSPTIFNVVVDAVVQHWVTVVLTESEARGELGQEGRHQAALFYTNDSMVASSDPAWLQGAFTALVGLFDRVGLQNNFGKTVGMVCHPCQSAGNLTTEAYGRRITGMIQSYRERFRDQGACRECREMLAVGSLSSHMITEHRSAAGRRRQWTTPAAVRGPQSYQMSFLEKGGTQECPVEGCPGRVATMTAMRHVFDTVMILEEGKFPQPRCAECNMQVPQRVLNRWQPGTAQCHKGAEHKRRRMAEVENSEHAFEAYVAPIEIVMEFKYLGRILRATDDN